MKLWLDAQLPPRIAATFGVDCEHLRESSLERSSDEDIFNALRQAGNVIVSKDEDFVDLVTRLDPPPQVLWVRVGNVTNAALKAHCQRSLGRAIDYLRAGESLVELTESTGSNAPE